MKQIGFTLVELMIAVTITLLLLMILSDIFFSLCKAIEDRESIAHAESQALQVMYYLNQQLPYAGFMGCFNLNRGIPIVNHLGTKQADISNSSVLSIEAQALTVKLVDHPVLFSESMKNSNDIIVNQIGALQKADVVVIGDCERAEVDQIKSIRKIMNKPNYKITLKWPLTHFYEPYATVAVLHLYRYFLKSVSYHKTLSALFVEDNVATHELVANVYDLRFQYLPNPQQPKAILVNFVIKDAQQKMDLAWQFIIPLLEKL